MTEPRPPIPEKYLLREDGRVLGNRRALAHLIGRSLPTVTNLAIDDPEFPGPAKIGAHRTYWYDLTILEAYAAVVRARYAAAAAGGAAGETASAGDEDVDLDEPLDPKAAAALIKVKLKTFHGYVWRSKPYWETGEAAPLLPRPAEDENGDIAEPLRWRRGDLLAHRRPGKGVGGGRGRTTRTPAPDPDADPEALLGPAAAALEYGTGYDTFHQRVLESEPLWEAGKPAPVPVPDAGFGDTAAAKADAKAGYRWKRRTLRAAAKAAA